MQRSLLSLAALTVFAAAANAQQCFEQNFGVLAPLAGGTAGFGDDVMFDDQPLGFTLTFGANSYTHAAVSENGIVYLTTGSGTNGPTGIGNAYQNIDVFLGTTIGDDPRIAPLFMDFWSQPGTSGGVYINNTIPGKFVVTWDRMVEWWATTQASVPNTEYTFQCQITDTGDVSFYFDSNVNGTINAGQNDPRCGVSRGDGVVDPGSADLSAAAQNLTDFVLYEAFPAYTPPATSPFDLQNTTVTFINAGTGYISVTQGCTPARNENYGTGCYDLSDSFYEEMTPTAMDLDGSIVSGLSLGPGAGYLVTTSAGAGGIAPGQSAVIVPAGDDDFVDTATVGGTLGIFVGSNGNISRVAANGNGFVPSVSTMLGNANEGLYAWTDLHSASGGGSGDIWYEENGTVATVTYLAVAGWNTGAGNTIQFIWDTATGDFSIEFENLNTTNPEVWLVGYSPAGPSTDDGGTDISAMNASLVSGQNVDAMTLSASGAPISSPTAGSTVTFTVDNMQEIFPGVTVGLLAVSLGQTNPGLPLGFLGAPGCNAYIASLDLTLTMTGGGSTLTQAFNLPAGLPSGVQLYSQAVNLVLPNSLPNGQNAFGMILSNGVSHFVNSF